MDQGQVKARTALEDRALQDALRELFRDLHPQHIPPGMTEQMILDTRDAFLPKHPEVRCEVRVSGAVRAPSAEQGRRFQSS